MGTTEAGALVHTTITVQFRAAVTASITIRFLAIFLQGERSMGPLISIN